MQVVRDEPGRRIHLEHVGARLTRRQGAILLILGGFWAGPAVVTFAAVSKPDFESTWQGICALVVWYGLLLPISFWIFRDTRHARAVSVDHAAGTWTIVERRLGALQDLTQTIPSSSCRAFGRGPSGSIAGSRGG